MSSRALKALFYRYGRGVGWKRKALLGGAGCAAGQVVWGLGVFRVRAVFLFLGFFWKRFGRSSNHTMEQIQRKNKKLEKYL